MLSFTHGTARGLPGENEAKKESLVTKLKPSYVRGERENRRFVWEVREMIQKDIHVDEERTACSNSLIQVQVPCGF